MERFSDWLLKELKSRKMTQSDLAKSAGLGSGTISNIMNGTRKVGQDTLSKIATALRLPPELVFEKAGIFKTSSDLTPKKRELMQRLETADDATVQMVIKMLEAAVEAQHRQVPGNLNPKTTPR